MCTRPKMLVHFLGNTHSVMNLIVSGQYCMEKIAVATESGLGQIFPAWCPMKANPLTVNLNYGCRLSKTGRVISYALIGSSISYHSTGHSQSRTHLIKKPGYKEDAEIGYDYYDNHHFLVHGIDGDNCNV